MESTQTKPDESRLKNSSNRAVETRRLETASTQTKAARQGWKNFN